MSPRILITKDVERIFAIAACKREFPGKDRMGPGCEARSKTEKSKLYYCQIYGTLYESLKTIQLRSVNLSQFTDRIAPYLYKKS